MRHRLTGSVVVSIAIHVVVAAAVIQALVAPHRVAWVFVSRSTPEPLSERIRYIAVRPPATRTMSARGDAQPARGSGRIAQRPIPVAPIPDARRSDDTTTVQARGSGPPPIGGEPGTGALRRGNVALVPSGADSRIVAKPATVPLPDPAHPDEIVKTVTRSIAAGTDSVVAVAAAIALTERRDWTLERGGEKYGIDSATIRIGRYSVPNLVLGLLPIRGAYVLCLPTGCELSHLKNPSISERATRIAEMSAEIRARAAVARDAREEIGRIAARKDGERAARRAAPIGATAPPAANEGSRPPPRGLTRPR